MATFAVETPVVEVKVVIKHLDEVLRAFSMPYVLAIQYVTAWNQTAHNEDTSIEIN